MAKKSAGKASNKEEMQRLCEELGVDKLYYNTRGEYFTEQSYAQASEGGDKKRVGTYESNPEKAQKEAVVESQEKEEAEDE